MNRQNALKGIIFALATSIVGSTAAAAGKVISQDVNVHAIVMLQFIFCSILILITSKKHRPLIFNFPQLKKHLLRSLAGWFGFIALYASLANISLVEANLLRNTAPLFVPLVTWVWLKITIPNQRWAPMIIGFIGVCLILLPSPNDIELNVGYLWGLGSGVGLAISMVGTRVLSKTESSRQIMFYYFFISLLCSCPLGIYYWQPIPSSAWPYLLYIGSSIYLALWLYTLAYSYAKPSLVSPMSYFSVIFSGILGWIIWKDIPSMTSIIGILVVVIAGTITVYLSSKETDTAQPTN